MLSVLLVLALLQFSAGFLNAFGKTTVLHTNLQICDNAVMLQGKLNVCLSAMLSGIVHVEARTFVDSDPAEPLEAGKGMTVINQ